MNEFFIKCIPLYGVHFIILLISHTIVPIFSPVFGHHYSTAKEVYMIQAKFSVEEAHIRFLNNYQAYGFKDKSALVRAAISSFHKEYERNLLKKSADLYSEIYSENKEMQDMTDSANK